MENNKIANNYDAFSHFIFYNYWMMNINMKNRNVDICINLSFNSFLLHL